MHVTITSEGFDLDKLIATTDKRLRGVQRSIGRDIAKVARKAILDDVRQSRGSLRFGTSRSTGRRYRLGAKSKIEPHGLVVDVTVTGEPQGFWSIVEYGSRSHDIYPRKDRQGRNGRPAALQLFGADFYAANVYHPGTTGRRYWAGAEDALDQALRPLLEDAYDEAFEEAS